MSQESGIPTFRDARSGLWEQFDPYQLASAEGYLEDKALVWGWYEWRRCQVLKTKPHVGHFAINQLSKVVKQISIITQNVDDLHERAGCGDVIHLHGSLHHPRCFDCAKPYKFTQDDVINISDHKRIEPPKCPVCGGFIRPGVVWFGETLPVDAWKKAEQELLTCDVFISIGTSSLVWPAAGLPELAFKSGATIIQINPDNTPLDDISQFNLKGKAGEILPRLAEKFSAQML